MNRTFGSFTLQFVSNIHSNCIREMFWYSIFLSKEKLLLLCFICKKGMCASFIFVESLLFYLSELMLSYFAKQGQIPDLMFSIQGRICDIFLFRTWQNMCHSIFQWRTTHDLIPSIRQIWCFQILQWQLKRKWIR